MVPHLAVRCKVVDDDVLHHSPSSLYVRFTHMYRCRCSQCGSAAEKGNLKSREATSSGTPACTGMLMECGYLRIRIGRGTYVCPWRSPESGG